MAASVMRDDRDRAHAAGARALHSGGASAGGWHRSGSIFDLRPSFASVSSYSLRRNGSSSQYGIAVPPSVTSIAPSSVSFSPGTPALSLRWLLGPYQPIRRSGSLPTPKWAWFHMPP